MYRLRAKLALATMEAHLDAERRRAHATNQPDDLGLHVGMVAAAMVVLGSVPEERREWLLAAAREALTEREGLLTAKGVVIPKKIKVEVEVEPWAP